MGLRIHPGRNMGEEHGRVRVPSPMANAAKRAGRVTTWRCGEARGCNYRFFQQQCWFAKMPSLNPDDKLLLIRCPTCGQRFKVGDALRGRTVECGGCEHRFKINDEVIVRGQKFYPGERREPSLSRFQRVPLAIAPDFSGIATMRYTEPPDATEFEPVAPQRIIAGAAGVCMMVLVALLLVFGAGRGSALDGMTTDKRLLMAGFAGFSNCWGIQ